MIFGTPSHLPQYVAVEKVSTIQLNAVLDALGEAKQKGEKFMKDNFSYLLEYVEENKKELEEILEFYFKDRWELQLEPGGTSQNLESIKVIINNMVIPEEKLKDRKQFFEFLLRQKEYNRIHSVGMITLLVHFPEINITNSSRQKHKIVDLWMKFRFNFFYRMLYMGGVRSSKSYSEYYSGYNHSHMPHGRDCERGTMLSCCLGETNYKTLQTQLYHNFDRTDMTLFMQQLEDYLSWESLQGGPHFRMEAIGQRNYGGNNTYINGNVLNQAYNDFLRKYPSGYTMQIEDNGFYYKFKVIKDEAFKEKVTDICPDQYKMLYDIVQKKQYVESQSDIDSKGIAKINDEYKRKQSLFTFKGKEVHFQVIDPNAGKEVAVPNIIKVAPDQIINHIAASLEQGINKYYVKKFQKEFLNTKDNSKDVNNSNDPW